MYLVEIWKGKKNWHGKIQASTIRNTLGHVFPISVLHIFAFFLFFLRRVARSGRRRADLGSTATSVCNFNILPISSLNRTFIRKQGRISWQWMMERRIYFKTLSEILLKKKSDFMQFKVIFHWSKVKYLCSLTAENTSFNYIMIQEKEKRIPHKSPSALTP